MYNIKDSQIGNLSNIYMDHIGYKTDGYFVEVGGYDGVAWSNTYDLALIGWHGLAFEPQEKFYKEFLSNYKNFPKISIEKCCIGSYIGETDLYIGGSLTTTSKEMVSIYKTLKWAHGCFSPKKKLETVKSPMYTLDNMLEKYNWPVGFDVLVIDTEGTELDVLNGLSIEKWRPKMMILELCETHEDKALRVNTKEVSNLMKKNKYNKVHMDSVNSIFVLEG